MIEMTPEKITLHVYNSDKITEITTKIEVDMSEYSHASGPDTVFLEEKWREELATKLAKTMIDEDLIHIDVDLNTYNSHACARTSVKFIQE